MYVLCILSNEFIYKKKNKIKIKDKKKIFNETDLRILKWVKYNYKKYILIRSESDKIKFILSRSNRPWQALYKNTCASSNIVIYFTYYLVKLLLYYCSY